MKYLLFIFFPAILFGQVNFSTYGAVGDGVTDDTAAIQAAMDAESNLIANASSTFKISSTLALDQSISNTINWNNSTMITDNGLSPMILVDKRTNNGGAVTMSNLTIDGNFNAARGIKVLTEIHLTDVDITQLQGTIPSPSGLHVEIYDHPAVGTSWSFTRCDITWVMGTDNGIITDAQGAANSILCYYFEAPAVDVVMTYKDSNINNCWSEDSGLMYVLDNTSDKPMTNSGTKWVLENMDFRDVERRTLKGFGGNIEAYNCTFSDPDPTNPNIGAEKTNSGLVTIGGYNNIFENCTFIRVGDYDGRVIPVNAYELSINNCTFVGGADLAITADAGNIDLCNNEFQAGSTIYDYGAPVDLGEIRIGNNNTFVEANPINLTAYSFVFADLNCSLIPESPSLLFGGKSKRSFFKLNN